MSVHAKKLEISTQNLDFPNKKNSCQMTLLQVLGLPICGGVFQPLVLSAH